MQQDSYSTGHGLLSTGVEYGRRCWAGSGRLITPARCHSIPVVSSCAPPVEFFADFGFLIIGGGAQDGSRTGSHLLKGRGTVAASLQLFCRFFAGSVVAGVPARVQRVGSSCPVAAPGGAGAGSILVLERGGRGRGRGPSIRRGVTPWSLTGSGNRPVAEVARGSRGTVLASPRRRWFTWGILCKDRSPSGQRAGSGPRSSCTALSGTGQQGKVSI